MDRRKKHDAGRVCSQECTRRATWQTSSKAQSGWAIRQARETKQARLRLRTHQPAGQGARHQRLCMAAQEAGILGRVGAQVAEQLLGGREGASWVLGGVQHGRGARDKKHGR